jgi:hypothetical protein
LRNHKILIMFGLLVLLFSGCAHNTKTLYSNRNIPLLEYSCSSIMYLDEVNLYDTGDHHLTR